jgi:hypothetical protein
MVKSIQEAIRSLSETLRDAIKKALDIVEEALKSSPCAGLCDAELAKARALQRELDRLFDNMPANDNDPEGFKAWRFKLLRVHDEIRKAQEDIIECMKRNGC